MAVLSRATTEVNLSQFIIAITIHNYHISDSDSKEDFLGDSYVYDKDDKRWLGGMAYFVSQSWRHFLTAPNGGVF